MDIILWLKGYLGGISQKEKDAICAEISGGSHPTNEYFTMLVISAIIATTGLLTNNVAVIIGGMLVSPLLMPIIGISLGAVKGDFELFSSAIEAEAKGVAIVIVLVAILTLMVPNAVVTGEILMRTAPTPLDLFVALASGTAAAYALTRKGISAALPGVAIAVAVMPPLCVVGIGFALKQPVVALGGALTFIANIVAINFAASAVFWLMEFSPHWSFAEEETKKKLQTSAVLLLLILLPLAWIMWQSIESSGINSTAEKVIAAQIDGIPGAKLADLSFERAKDGSLAIYASLDSPKSITHEKAGEMRLALEKNLGTAVSLSLDVNYVELVVSPQAG